MSGQGRRSGGARTVSEGYLDDEDQRVRETAWLALEKLSAVDERRGGQR